MTTSQRAAAAAARERLVKRAKLVALPRPKNPRRSTLTSRAACAVSRAAKTMSASRTAPAAGPSGWETTSARLAGGPGWTAALAAAAPRARAASEACASPTALPAETNTALARTANARTVAVKVSRAATEAAMAPVSNAPKALASTVGPMASRAVRLMPESHVVRTAQPAYRPAEAQNATPTAAEKASRAATWMARVPRVVARPDWSAILMASAPPAAGKVKPAARVAWAQHSAMRASGALPMMSASHVARKAKPAAPPARA
jgi:hypothetical protein